MEALFYVLIDDPPKKSTTYSSIIMHSYDNLRLAIVREPLNR